MMRELCFSENFCLETRTLLFYAQMGQNSESSKSTNFNVNGLNLGTIYRFSELCFGENIDNAILNSRLKTVHVIEFIETGFLNQNFCFEACILLFCAVTGQHDWKAVANWENEIGRIGHSDLCWGPARRKNFPKRCATIEVVFWNGVVNLRPWPPYGRAPAVPAQTAARAPPTAAEFLLNFHWHWPESRNKNRLTAAALFSTSQDLAKTGSLSVNVIEF